MKKLSTTSVVGLTLASVAGIVIVVAAIASAGSDDGHEGEHPHPHEQADEAPAWLDPEVEVTAENLPEFIPVGDRETGDVVGYALSRDVYKELFDPSLLEAEPGQLPDELEAPVAVYADESTDVLVGHVYTEVGYVSLEEERAPGFDLDELRVKVTVTQEIGG